MAKILIVDDDALITQLLESLVGMDGHQAIVVNDSTAAMEVAKSENPDLITLDVMMPELNGFELCALLHADPQFAQTPIVMISAKGDQQSKDMAMAAGAIEYINKPFHLKELLGMIKKLIS